MFDIKDKKIKINYLWNLGDISKLKSYYRSENIGKFEKSESKNFYAIWKNDVARIVHTGLPKSISETIIDLIGIDNIEIKTEKEKDNEFIKTFYEKNKILDKLEKAINNLTWSGECFYKFNSFGEINIDIVNPLNSVTNYKNGYIDSYDFLIWENEEKTERIRENYGNGYIVSYYEKRKQLKDEYKIVEETKTIFNVEIILAGSIKLENDAYSKSLQIFDAIDETYSRMTDEARKGKMQRFIDESLLRRDSNGNIIPFDDENLKNWTILKGVRTEDGKPLIEFIMADIDPEKRYLKTYSQYSKDCVRNAGLSYHTFAGGEMGGNGLSADAQRELEKLSIRTRRRYINRLKPLIKKMFQIVLMFSNNDIKINNIKKSKEIIDKNETFFDKNIVDKYKVEIIFQDYIQNSLDGRIKLWGSPEAQSNFPISYRIKQILEGDIPENEIDKLVLQINNENGINADLDDNEDE